MKTSARIDGSIYGAILHTRPAQSFSKRASLSTARNDNGRTQLCVGFICARSLRSKLSPEADNHRRSFNVKVSCSFYSTVTSRGARRPLSSTYFTSHAPCRRSWNHTSSGPAQLFPSKPLPPPTRSREELLAFVDQYDDVTVEEHLEYLSDPYMRRYAPPDTPKLIVSDRVQSSSPAPDEVERGGDEEQEVVTRLRAAVFSKLIRPHSVDLETIYHLYRLLPDQRISYLPARLRHALLAVLGITERKNPRSMLRYFAVVADVKNSGYPLTRVQWNTALSFASRYVGTSTEVELEAALHLWREMEHDAGIKGNEVTLNILFDVASKSGKLVLAEMIFEEMNKRGHRFNRYHHVSLIHFFGLKMNASGVRAAYKQMIEAGEIIDSVTLNCVIAGFIRSGDEESAERVYERMKATDERSKIIPQRNYYVQKQITKVLMMFARFGRKNPDMQPRLQGTAIVTPDLHTYRILINHFGVRLGNLYKVSKYLDEMKFFRVPLHGAIFLALFKSFSIHGYDGSDWSSQRLESVWSAMLEAFDGGSEGLYINTWMTMWVLRAFSKCGKSRDRILAAYEELSARWDLDDENSSFMLNFLHRLLQRNGLSVHVLPRPRSGTSSQSIALGSRSQEKEN